jgi:hypothetical protein
MKRDEKGEKLKKRREELENSRPYKKKKEAKLLIPLVLTYSG